VASSSWASSAAPGAPDRAWRPPSELARELSLFHITMMGLGMMIGAGVFIGIGNSMQQAGPGGVVLTFALNGLVALFTAMSFAELSSAIPRAGGAYNFARIAFGRGPSFLAGWMEWFASSAAGSLYAVVFATYTLHFFGELGWLGPLATSGFAKRAVAVAVAGVFIYVNYRGASETGRVGALFTMGQMLFVVAIAVVGIVVSAVDPQRVQNFKPFLPYGWGKLLVTMGFVYVAFEGFEVIAQAGDEAIQPKSNIPKAMLYSVFIVTLTYVGVSFATVVAVHPSEWIGSDANTVFARAVSKLMPGEFVGHLLVTLAVIFSSTSALNATIYSGTRASYALGRDRMLPAAFASISKKRKTPWLATLFTSALLVPIALLPTEDVASAASMMFLFLFLLVNECVIKIRLNMGDELTYGFLMPLFPLPPVIAIVCQGLLAGHIIHMSLIAWIVAPAWLAAGVGIYFLYSRRRAIATEDEIRVFEESAAPAAEGYRIMVAVANPDNALELVQGTYRLCGAKHARVELLHMVPVPRQVPLADAEKYMLEGKEGIIEAMLYLAPLFPISTTLRYCRNVARGIVTAVREKRIDMLILGWHGRARAWPFKLGSTVDPVIERSPCNVVMLENCGGDRTFRKVLVPLAGGPNAVFALEVAGILAEKDEGTVTAFTVANPKRPFDLPEFLKAHRQRVQLPAGRIHAKTVQATNVVEAILTEAEEHDLIVLGCTQEPLIYRIARETVPETVAKLCDKPVAMVKASGGIRSWLRRYV
jgi:APA family basic amino acid/polyamine antiporter